ncbi:cellulose-binding protein [Methylococcus capsulatus]|uniref:cellulose-binding protein n=1 Tax=Methylococcus capsulatus TaxID=414 RepID=UPI0020173083|nr:cellulose-binding protein [Methylococcus capsulatus]UQN12901.1 cellulose-binding protein [Methylococcus capsulatus]
MVTRQPPALSLRWVVDGMGGRWLDGIYAAALCLGLTACDEPDAPTPDSGFGIGVNIAGLAYYGTEIPFVDLFKLSGPWLTQCRTGRDPGCNGQGWPPGASAWNTLEQDALVLDAAGYPKSLPDPARNDASGSRFTSVATLVPTDLNPSRPAGRFIVRYQGQGTLGYARGAVRNAVLSRPGRDVVDVTGTGGEYWFELAILATDPGGNGDHLRNIRVVPEGGTCEGQPTAFCTDTQTCGTQRACRPFEEADPIFDPRFLRNLAPFRAIRFMAYQNTNDSTAVGWTDRTVPDSRTWASEGGDGGPAELIPALGNRLQADVWVNMPARADDGYVRQFAMLVRRELDKDRKVYVEYGNEAWNDAFSAGRWMEVQALAKWPGAGESAYGKRLQWYGMRTAQICDIWEEVWAEEGDRVICVMGSQAANPWTARQALDCRLWRAERGGAPCYRHHVRALAIAPYFGHYLGLPEHAAVVKEWSTDPDGGLHRLFTEIFYGGELPGGPAGGALEEAKRQMQENKRLASEYGLNLVAYEGGQHLVGVGEAGTDPAITALFVAANRDERMGEAYLRHLEDWRAAGGGLYNLWNSAGPYTRWGSWGLLEYRDQPGAPKYDAVRAAMPRE